MRYVALFALLLVPATAFAADTWTTPHPGIRRLHRTTATQNINVLVVDLCASGISVRATKSGERQRVVSSFASLVGAEVAINGDFFSFDTYSTTGPAMGDGVAWGGDDDTFDSPVQFGPNQVLLPGPGSTAGLQPWARQAVSGHPALIVNGVKKDYPTYALCTTENPRTALGFTADHEKMIVAVVDGRATGRVGMTCAELATLLAEFDADDAVNLDGGGSSTMWIKGSGVVNFPSDGAERVVANHLAIHAGGSAAPAHCPLPKYAATLVAAEAPVEMIAGDTANVALEFANAGDIAWDDNTRVGTQDPQDRASVFAADTWLSPDRPAVAAQMFAPGATGRFAWTMRAPDVSEPTTFDETFQLVQEGVTWFGPKHTLSILVVPRTGDGDGNGDGDGASSGCSAGSGHNGLGLGLALGLALALRSRRRC